MSYVNVAINSFKPDLRSAKSTTIQRGLFIRLLRVILLILLDISSLSIAWNLVITYSSPLQSEWTKNLPFLLLSLGVQIAILVNSGVYRAGMYRRDYVSIIKAISLSSILLLFIAYIYDPSTYIQRSNYLLYWLVSIAFICTFRKIFDLSTNFLRQKGIIRHAIFIIADAEEKEQLINIVEKDNCYTVQGFAESSCLDWANREKTFAFLSSQNVEEIFISWDAIKNRSFLCWHFYNAGITLHILPTENKLPFSKSQFSLIGELPFPTITAPIFAGVDFWFKRLFDFYFALFLIVLLAPVYLSIAVLIKLDSPGPIFFRQKRIGLHNREFLIWKFRTMITDAEKIQVSLEAKNEMKDGVFFKMKNDPRVTRVGQFLRRYSLDELPQFFNVLVGEMSLIGPRPLPIRDVEKFQPKHFIRQEVLPGITGLWQVSGRSEIDNFDDVIKLDMSYIENWSISLDLNIFLRTFKVLLYKTGAY
ncbi:MAG: sugar transferase [Richelia sp. RM2_1_2]|nr:sugar transferase [Richelia sp. SM2_1_7]NJM19677.1 sugar transferase [Richelia sp. SM1_7_0]NJN09684.1 sugar transferase [Richelia sp. RM1_1_1]NJO27990.1 sugar transferase [Richelia sp. SL_2_1]NJO59806.1 sugar transferase [Richelia sp. RM2_1_2]